MLKSKFNYLIKICIILCGQMIHTICFAAPPPELIARIVPLHLNSSTPFTSVAFCSGVLLNATQVLTAKHCVEAGNNAEEMAATLSREEGFNGFEIVAKIGEGVFSKIVGITLDSEPSRDLALLNLEPPGAIGLTTLAVVPANTPKIGDHIWFWGQKSGWKEATMETQDPMFRAIFNWTQKKIGKEIPSEDLARSVIDTLKTRSIVINNLMIPGDSGGGLFVQVGSVWRVAGITAQTCDIAIPGRHDSPRKDCDTRSSAYTTFTRLSTASSLTLLSSGKYQLLPGTRYRFKIPAPAVAPRSPPATRPTPAAVPIPTPAHAPK